MSARPPILSLKDVRLQDGAHRLFEGVDLALEPRGRACLVGRNGAGKSTLMRMLAGEIEADAGELFIQPGARVVRVSQEPAITGETLRDYAASGGAAPHEADAELEAFGLSPEKSATGLSGGEARRAALAKAFAEAPEVLLLDEPTNHLDILAIETLEERVKATRAAVLVVSHDRAFLERITRTSFWLEDRKVRRLDKGFAHFESWTAKVAEQEAEIARKQDKMIEREAYWLARGVTARRARNEGRLKRLKDLRAEKSERMRQERGSMSVAVDSGGASGKRVVEAKKLNKAYGGRVLLKDFSTRILRGDRVAVVGPNGAGKTTLVKMLLGEVAPDSGSVKLGSNLQTAYLDQARAALKPGLTLWETLAPLGGDQVLVRGQPRHVAAYAKDFLFRDNQLRQPVESLSGGERNRLLLAVALARPANLLVLDEPTNDLDMDTLDLLEELLADYDGTLILVSHDRDFVDRLATSTIALDGTGRAVETPGGWQDFVRQNPGFFMQAGAQSRPLHPPSGGPPPPLRGGGTKTASSSTVKRSGTGEGDHAKHGGGGVTTRKSAKLTYKDARRLEELDALMPRLHAQIAALEATLSDATLYARDPQAFGKAMSEITAARTTLAAAEEEWLVLEEKKEALG